MISRKWQKSPRLTEDELAEFLTKTERRKCENMEKDIARWMLSIFKGYLQRKKPVFISWNEAEKQAKVLKNVYEEVSLLRA